MDRLPQWQQPDLYALAFGRAEEKQGRQLFGCRYCRRRFKSSDLGETATLPIHGKQPCAGSGQPAQVLERKVLPPVAAQIGGWEGARIAAATLLRKVAIKYGRERYQVIWRRERRTAEYRYPFPFPVHQQSWIPFFTEQRNQPAVICGLPGGRVSLRLRGGYEFAPAVRVFQRLVDGDLAQQELSLTRQRSYWNGARRDTDRLPGGGNREHYRVMVRIAYRMEALRCDGQGTWRATTGGGPFLILNTADRPDWILHAPHVQQWINGHSAFRQRFADDLKYEKRWPRGKRRRMLRRQERGCDRQNDRLRSFLQETAAQVVGHARRNGCGIIIFNDADRSFADPFPWRGLREALKCKCDQVGIVLETVEPEADTSEDEE